MIAVPKNVAKAVKTDLYDALRKGLTEPGRDGQNSKAFIEDYVNIMLKEAKTNPNGPIGSLIARQLLQDDIISSLDQEADKYMARDVDFNEYRLLKTLYREQQMVYTDPASKIIVIGSRRIGKTELSARLLLKDIFRPDRHALYINTNFENAINQCYSKVLDLVKSLGLPVIEARKNEGFIKFYNGSDIYFKGNNDKSAADKRQGYKYSTVVIDEVQSQVNLPYLMDVILKPAMSDYDDAKLICIGTPPRVPHTRAEKIWKEYKGWSKYNWDMSKNPYIKNYEKLLRDICEEKGVTEDEPFIQREYKGIFVYDEEARIFRNPLFYTESLEELIAKNEVKIDYVYGGVDFGFSDYNSIVMIAWDKTHNKGYVLDPVYKFNRATVTEIVEKMKAALEKAQDILIASDSDPHNVWFYGDNSDKSIIAELSQNYNFPISSAYKHDKMAALSLLSDMTQKCIYTPQEGPLSEEYEMMVYKRDEATDAILSELDDDVYHADSVMAFLYASRQLVFDENPLGSIQAVKEKERINKPATDDDDPDWIYGSNNETDLY